MEINKLFILIATAVVFGYISATQSTDVKLRRRDKDGICSDNDDCYPHEKCEKGQCTDICSNTNCGIYTWCTVTDHEAVCNCWDNYVRDSRGECALKNCTINNDCNDYEKCENAQCVNACDSISCGNDTRCKSTSHEAYCVCMYGLVGDPGTKCEKKSCSANSDCYFNEKCENNVCMDACEGVSCGINAWCESKGHAAVCTCSYKHTGDPHIECVRENCTDHNDCYSFEKCESNQCEIACDSVTCGENAQCYTYNHVPECQCTYQMTGDPNVKCSEKECTTDSDCPKSEYCNSTKCTQACDNVLCGSNAYCDAKNHTASCICIEKYTADPQTECVRQSCSTSEDCYLHEKCEGDKCVPACGPSQCGKNAWCGVEQHVANCSCAPGFSGDPLVGCEHKDCTTNADCSNSEKCENKKCIDVCDESFCPFNTICKAQDHAVTCACFEKHEGDAYSGCVRLNCSVPNDCYDYETCENNKCIPACDNVNCEGNGFCNVVDHVAACTCLDDVTGETTTKCDGVRHFGSPVPIASGKYLAFSTP